MPYRCLSNVGAGIITTTRHHILAKDLMEVKAPFSLLQHAKKCDNDKQMWDQSYFEEYDGLQQSRKMETDNQSKLKTISMCSCYGELRPPQLGVLFFASAGTTRV